MSYLPHVVKATAGMQPAVVEKYYLYNDVNKPDKEKVTIYLDVKLLGSPSKRQRLRHIRFLGQLTFPSASTDVAYVGRTASASGGFYDAPYAFLTTTAGGALSAAARENYLKSLLEGKTVTVQNLGGRWVAT